MIWQEKSLGNQLLIRKQLLNEVDEAENRNNEKTTNNNLHRKQRVLSVVNFLTRASTTRPGERKNMQ